MDRVRGVEKVFSIECNSVFRTRISLKITVVFSTGEYILRYCININCTRGCWIVNIYIKRGEKINFSNENWRRRNIVDGRVIIPFAFRFTPISNIIPWFNFLVRLGNLRVYTFVLEMQILSNVFESSKLRIIVSANRFESLKFVSCSLFHLIIQDNGSWSIFLLIIRYSYNYYLNLITCSEIIRVSYVKMRKDHSVWLD